MSNSGSPSGGTLVLLALALLGAAPGKHEQFAGLATQGPLPEGPISYLVTAAGRTFRLLGSAPITDAGGKKLAVMVSYEGQTRDVADATASASELMDSLGPQLLVAGETDVVVQSRVGFDPRRRFNNTTAFHVTFELRDGRWVALPITAGRPKTVGSGPLEEIDDPEYSLDKDGLAEGAKVASRWMAALDRGDVSALRQEVSESYAAELESRQASFERFVSERALLKRNPTAHRELYRMQTRSGGRALPGGRGILFLFDADGGSLGRSIEQVALAQEKGRWRVWSFVSQAVKKPLQR